MNEFLPIGSVCRLKTGKIKIMIMGYSVKDKENPDKTYDYLGCPYPTGVISSKDNLYFNHDQIEEVFYKAKPINDKANDIINQINNYMNNN